MLWFKSSQYSQQGYPGPFEKARSTRFTFILSDNNHKLLVTIIYYYDLVWMNIFMIMRIHNSKTRKYDSYCMTHTVWLKLYESYSDVFIDKLHMKFSIFQMRHRNVLISIENGAFIVLIIFQGTSRHHHFYYQHKENPSHYLSIIQFSIFS